MVAPAPTTYAVITGGATSGHVVPALSIIELLVEAGHPRETLVYVGSDRGVETTLVPQTGIACVFLSVDGLQRGMSLTKVKRNLRMLPTMMRATQLATQVLVQHRPRVVVSVGGYVSAPICRAARHLKIPVVTCSYDSKPGMATKMQARYAATVAVAHTPSTLRRAQLTGAPVRAELRHLDRGASRAASRMRLGFSADAKLVVVMGGSLGSAVLNSATESLVAQMESPSLANVAILHIAGSRYMEGQQLASEMRRPDGSMMYQRIAYSSNMSDIYAAADLVVARAGASTVAEIATVGIASVLVPWKDAAENHQLTNAKSLSDPGGAVLLEESKLAADVFVQLIGDLLGDESMRLHIANEARKLGEVHRNCSIAAVVEKAADGVVR
jgi:UDP-N-acetylglucosamine--N-acetylmuramyl-(pentapeptide) pyrophosphoryl-undecaprenol N-acetylglucosamine transferase